MPNFEITDDNCHAEMCVYVCKKYCNKTFGLRNSQFMQVNLVRIVHARNLRMDANCYVGANAHVIGM